MQKIKGFTLLELLITVTILSVLMIFAVPSFQSMIERNNVINTANDLVASFLMARSTAVTREENIRIQRAGSWNNGWRMRAADNSVIGRTHIESDGIVITANSRRIANALTYTPEGRTTAALESATDYFKISHGSSERCVLFTTTGRPSTGECP